MLGLFKLSAALAPSTERGAVFTQDETDTWTRRQKDWAIPPDPVALLGFTASL